MNHSKSLLTLAFCASFALATSSSAQDQQMNTPTDLANANAGECYAQVYSPAKYETTTRRVLKSDASFRIETVPAVYENATERIMTKESSERLEVVPAVYGTVEERVMVKEAGTRLESVPAVYETVRERVQVTAARKVWKSSNGKIYGTAVTDDQGKLVTRPSATGEVLCLVEEPAEFKTVTKKMLKQEATTREVAIPAEYKTIKKTVLKTPPTTQKVTIPAEYDTITKRVLKTPATTRRVEIPAEYETVTERVTVSEASVDWVPVLCEVNVTASKVRSIQSALKKSGHYGGPIDGVFGSGTGSAIASFQRQNNLSQGYGLTLETLEVLKVQ
ncbi:MAG: peptidoglycan-binding protein [Rhodothermales bacterium]|nr:peptidoglycan-binding protein [Rhodothermales bacterium]